MGAGDDRAHVVLEAVEEMNLVGISVNVRGTGSEQYPPQALESEVGACLSPSGGSLRDKNGSAGCPMRATGSHRRQASASRSQIPFCVAKHGWQTAGLAPSAFWKKDGTWAEPAQSSTVIVAVVVNRFLRFRWTTTATITDHE